MRCHEVAKEKEEIENTLIYAKTKLNEIKTEN